MKIKVLAGFDENNEPYHEFITIDVILYNSETLSILRDKLIILELALHDQAKSYFEQWKHSFVIHDENEPIFFDMLLSTRQKKTQLWKEYYLVRDSINIIMQRYGLKVEKPKLDIANAKKCPIIDLVERHYKIKIIRNVISCPFHSERTASCMLYADTNRFHCFGCGADGSVIDFVMKYENIGFTAAVNKLNS